MFASSDAHTGISGLWTLSSGRWSLYPGCLTLDAGRCIPGSGHRAPLLT